MQTNVAHKCLGIPEIQTAILTTLTPTDCAKLARTCTWLYAQAVDVVWQDLSSLALLVRCMPSDLIVETSNTIALISFIREPTEADWKLFHKHTRRVKRFTEATGLFPRELYNNYTTRTSYISADYRLDHGALRTVTTHLARKAADDKMFSLFPHLISLNILAFPNAQFPTYLPHLCCDTLTSLEIDFNRSTRDSDYVCQDLRCSFLFIIPQIKHRWTAIRDISLTGDPFPLAAGTIYQREEIEFQAWLRGLHQLRSFQGRTQSALQIVQTLSQLPYLESFRLLASEDHFIPAISQSSTPCFSSLQTLDLSLSDPNTPALLLQPLAQSSTLRTVKIEYHCNTKVSSETLFDSDPITALFTALSHLPLLSTLNLHLRPQAFNGAPSLTSTLLSSLFPLHHIRLIHLIGWRDISLTDGDLENAATAWPELEDIQLIVMDMKQLYTETTVPRTTLAGVQALYNGCPRLLCLDVLANVDGLGPLVTTEDAHTRTRVSALRGADVPSPRTRDVPLKTLTLGLAASDDAWLDAKCGKKIAMLVCLMFPQLKAFVPWTDSLSFNYEWDDEVREQWEIYREMEVGEVRALMSELGG